MRKREVVMKRSLSLVLMVSLVVIFFMGLATDLGSMNGRLTAWITIGGGMGSLLVMILMSIFFGTKKMFIKWVMRIGKSVAVLAIFIAIFFTYGPSESSAGVILKNNGELTVVTNNGFRNPFTTRVIDKIYITKNLSASSERVDVSTGDNLLIGVRLVAFAVALSENGNRPDLTSIIQEHETQEAWALAVKQVLYKIAEELTQVALNESTLNFMSINWPDWATAALEELGYEPNGTSIIIERTK